MNATKALRIYLQNHHQNRWPTYSATMRNFVKELEETGFTCGKPRSGQTTLPEDTLMEMHHIVTSGYMQTVKGASRILDIPKTTLLKLPHFVICVFPYQYQRVHTLDAGGH